MTWLIIILVSLIIVGLIVKFMEKIANLVILMIGLMFLGLVIIPFNMEIGVKLAASMFFILLILGVVFMFSGVISAFVLAPLYLIWSFIKSLFK